jgi:predicted P-loop ATPase
MISYWTTVKDTKNPTEETSIDVFIDRVKNGYWREMIAPIRLESDKEKQKPLKNKLPAVTIGGSFNERNEKSLLKHSGYMCVDIDNFSDNTALINDPYTFCCMKSVGGNGFAVIVKVNPDKHKDCYRWIEKYYLTKYGVLVDSAPKNVASARYITFDENLYLNTKSKKCPSLIEKPLKPKTLAVIIPNNEIGELMDQVHTNVLEEYHDWLCFGLACVATFKEDGRSYFHKMSSLSNKYDANICDKNYDYLLKRKGEGINQGTFYYYLKQAGVDISKYSSNKTVNEIALNKRIGVSKSESAVELSKKENLSIEEAKVLVDEIYERNDIDVRHQTGTENIIINVSNFIFKKHELRKNSITHKYEIDGKEMQKEHFNSLYLKARMTFDDNSVTYDLIERIIMSEATMEFNPIQQYIEANKHRNSTGNIDKMVETILSKSSMKKTWIKKWLLSIIACYDGHPVRSVLCLTGGQNTGKTEWFRRLLPAGLQKYYAESNMDKGKDDELLMCEKLIVLDDEMGGKSKQDEKRFKELTSKNFFSLRAPYGRHNEDFKRLALLCGTTNEKAVINDPTGNTRILPIEVDSINHDLYNSIDKDELFMELYRMYTTGVKWQLDKDEISILMEISQEFETIPFEKELILRFFEVPKDDDGFILMTATAIKDVIESNSKQKIMSMKIFGTTLKKIFGDQVQRKDGWKYKVKEKYGLKDDTKSWID